MAFKRVIIRRVGPLFWLLEPMPINREILEAQKELLVSSYSQAQAYTNLVLAAGYAGGFGIWSLLKDSLTPATVFWAGLLLTISLACFIAWEVFNMYLRSRSHIEIAKAINEPERFDELILAFKKTEQDRALKYGRMWHVVLWVTVATGAGALCIFLSAFVHGIWRSYSGL